MMCTVITQSRYRNVSDLTATARNKGGDPHEGEKHMNRKAGVSKHLRFKDSFMDRAFMYTLALQSHKGSEYGECYYAASKIRDGDPESWMKAWTEVAKRVEDIARKADAKGHRVSAREAYLRAFTYYRRAFAAMRLPTRGLGRPAIRFAPVSGGLRPCTTPPSRSSRSSSRASRSQGTSCGPMLAMGNARRS